jgi:hypothetical protein
VLDDRFAQAAELSQRSNGAVVVARRRDPPDELEPVRGPAQIRPQTLRHRGATDDRDSHCLLLRAARLKIADARPIVADETSIPASNPSAPIPRRPVSASRIRNAADPRRRAVKAWAGPEIPLKPGSRVKHRLRQGCTRH